MNKKDIIIIAVLLNTGLLSALAMMAINTDDSNVDNQTEISQIALEKEAISPKSEEKNVMIAQNTSVATDEWDTVLKDYVSGSTSQMMTHDDEISDDFERQAEAQKEISQPNHFVPKNMVNEQPKAYANYEQAATPGAAPGAVPVAVAVTVPGKTIKISVKRGDALEKIARANGTTVEQIRALNNLKNDRLTIGQILLVPSVQSVQNEEARITSRYDNTSASPARTSDDVEYYIIKQGDNPWKIAKQFKVKFEDLLRLNNLDEERARNLKIGDRIRVK